MQITEDHTEVLVDLLKTPTTNPALQRLQERVLSGRNASELITSYDRMHRDRPHAPDILSAFGLLPVRTAGELEARPSLAIMDVFGLIDEHIGLFERPEGV